MKPTLTDSIRGEITKYGNRSDDVRKALGLCPATYYKRIRSRTHSRPGRSGSCGDSFRMKRATQLLSKEGGKR